MKRTFLIFSIILGVAIYSNSFQAEFHLDDVSEIVEYVPVWHLDVGRLWAEHKVRFLPYLTFALNHRFGKLNVFPYHAVNIAIHITSAFLVYLFVLLLSKTPEVKDKIKNGSVELLAWFSGLMFLTHPVQTQAVTYIVQRIASLASLFYLASVVSYLKWRLEKKSIYYVLSIAAAFSAMFSKEIAYTLPIALGLTEFSFFAKDRMKKSQRILWLLPYCTLWAVVYFVGYHADLVGGNIYQLTRAGSHVPRSQYMLTQFNVIRTYLRLLFFPAGQNLDYDYPISKSLFELKTFASFLLLAAVFMLAIRLWKKQRLISFGILWVFLTLSVESSFFPIHDVIFEHRLYLPMFGFALGLSTGLYSFVPRPKVFFSFMAVAIGILSVLTFMRNRVWKDEITLWQDIVRKSPGKARAFDSLGVALGQAGRYEEAKQLFDQVLKLDPKSVNTYNSLGVRLAEEGDYEGAMKHFEKAIEIDPQYVNTYNSLGIISARKGDLEAAIRYYDLALRHDPDFAKAHYNLGISLAKLGRTDEAISHYRKAIEIDPDSAGAYFNLANTFSDQGMIDEARQNFEKALKINPGYPEARTGLGLLFYKQGKIEEAIRCFEETLRNSSGYVEAHNNLAVVLVGSGRLEEARAHLREALRLNPNSESVRRNLEALDGESKPASGG